jgi:hypothetical protein
MIVIDPLPVRIKKLLVPIVRFLARPKAWTEGYRPSIAAGFVERFGSSPALCAPEPLLYAEQLRPDIVV